MSELTVGTEITLRYGGDIQSIGKIDRVTEKRAFFGSHQFYKEVGRDGWLRVFGNSSGYRSYSATLTTDAHRAEVAYRTKKIQARRFFEALMVNADKMIAAYDQLNALSKQCGEEGE